MSSSDQVVRDHRIIVCLSDKGTMMLHNIMHYAHNNRASHPRTIYFSAPHILKQQG